MIKNSKVTVYTSLSLIEFLSIPTFNAVAQGDDSSNEVFEGFSDNDFNCKRKMCHFLNLQAPPVKNEYSTADTDEKELASAINKQFGFNAVNQPLPAEQVEVDDFANNANSVVEDDAKVFTGTSVAKTPILSDELDAIDSVNTGVVSPGKLTLTEIIQLQNLNEHKNSTPTKVDEHAHDLPPENNIQDAQIPHTDECRSNNDVISGVVYPGRHTLTDLLQHQHLNEPGGSGDSSEETRNLTRFTKNVKGDRLKCLTRFFFKGKLDTLRKLSSLLTLPPNVSKNNNVIAKNKKLLISNIAGDLSNTLSQSFKSLCGCKIPNPKYDSHNKRQGRGNYPNLLRLMLTISLIKNCIAEPQVYYCYTNPSCPNGISGWIPAEYFPDLEVKQRNIEWLMLNLDHEIEKRVEELNECIQKNIEKIKRNSNKIETLIKTISKVENFVNNPSGVLGFALNWQCQKDGKSLKKLIKSGILQPAFDALTGGCKSD